MAWFESKRYKKLQAEVKALQSLSYDRLSAQVLAGINQHFDSTNYYPDWDTATISGKYASSDQVYSVINKIAETSALIPMYVYINKNEKALKQVKSLSQRQFYSTKGLFDLKVWQVKALEDAPEDDPLNKLLDNPNDYQSKAEFLTMAYVFYLLNGECFIYIDRTEEGGNEGKPYQLHILPPANVTMRITREFPQTITGYDFVVGAQTLLKDVSQEDIIHWKKQNVSFSVNGSHLRGLSPLRPGSIVLDRLSEADKRSINQLKNGALPGIVSNESFEGDESEQTVFDKQKKAFFDFITNKENHGAPFFAGGKLSYTQVGLSAADLKLIELQGIDFKRLCNIYKVSTILFNSDASSTESNVREMIKQMYTSACIPMVFALRDKLNAALTPAYDDKPRYINADISSITELQENIKDMVDSVAALPISLTGDELRSLLNYDATNIDWMQQPLIKSGYSFYDDITIPPVDPKLL